jgi:branched-chain amino acid transport system substrate-binding protein
MKKWSLTSAGGFFLVVLLMMFVTYFAMPAAHADAKDKIVIGCAISLSGMNAIPAQETQVHEYKLWAEQKNAEGGLYVKKYGKKLPVELKFYDDNSNVETCTKMVEKLILEDKVDLLLPPWGTAFNFAVAPLVSKYHYIMIGSSISSAKFKELASSAPYFFIILNQPQKQAESLVNLMKELGVKSVAVIHVADLFGIEHTGQFVPRAEKAGIKIVLKKSYPLGVNDLSPLIKTIQADNPDAMVAYSYPDSTFLLAKQMIALNYSPKLLFLGVGAHFPDFRDSFGKNTVQGVMGVGAWNPKVPAKGAKEFFDAFTKRWGKEPPRWGEASSYAALQIMDQAIQKVGSLDQKKMRDVIAKDTFDTVIGKVKFVDNTNPNYPGDVGQWQNGEYEIVAPKDKRTAQPIYPKPAWPAAK